MLDHPIVDVALGLILLYTVLSLFASVAKEWILYVPRTPGDEPAERIQTLIGTEYAKKLYERPLVNSLATGKKLPSYIGSGTFASALVDLLAHVEEDQAASLVRRASDAPELRRTLRALSRSGAETVADLRPEIAVWFDDSMNLSPAGTGARRS